MSNHIHLLIDDNGNDISKLIKSINISYAYYFNRTYRRCGHLFQDRFRSELIDSDAYLIEVSKYIHNNPVKAGLVKDPWEYGWSSCDAYTGRRKSIDNLISAARILSLFSANPSVAAKEYEIYVTGVDTENVRIMDEEDRIEDRNCNSGFIDTLEQAKNKVLEAILREGLSYDEAMKDKSVRNKLMKQIRMNSSLTLKQIGELFDGVSESRVSRILGKG
jgi:putative transposase